MWGQDAPPGAVKTVQVHVSRLRKALGDPEALTTTPAGYRLRVRPGELDAERFAHGVAEGRRALEGGDAERAGVVLREALKLWHGPALAGLEFEPFAAAEIARLEEQRLAALEVRVEADLARGAQGALVSELQQLRAEHPTRERLTAQLMLALYRSGRQVEALKVYRDARQILIGAAGVTVPHAGDVRRGERKPGRSAGEHLKPERLRRPGVCDSLERPRLGEPARDELPERGVATGVGRAHPREDDGVVVALGVGIDVDAADHAAV